MPCCCDSNYDEYINYLSKISTVCDEIDSPNVLIVGDFNACPNNNFGILLSQFCLEHELKISDKINLPANFFTYVNDTHGTCSWLDHVVSSKSAHDPIQNTEILHQFILSDHRPVAADNTKWRAGRAGGPCCQIKNMDFPHAGELHIDRRADRLAAVQDGPVGCTLRRAAQ